MGIILAPIKAKTKRCWHSWNSAAGRSLLFLEQLEKDLGKFGILVALRMKRGKMSPSTWRYPVGEGKVCEFWG